MLYLKEVSYLMKHVLCELYNLHKTFKDEELSSCQINNILLSLKHVIVSFLEVAS